MSTPPQLSYTIWFTQRNGSTLLTRALEQIGTVGKPGEWLNDAGDHSLFQHYNIASLAELLPILWQYGSGKNGVFGQKVSMQAEAMQRWIPELQQATALLEETNPTVIWEKAFPHHRHLFLTRRNKVRQAVSWWKAIQTQEWHRDSGQSVAPHPEDLANRYDFAAIRHLMTEIVLREAAIEDFFAAGDIQPMTIVYEDFVRKYEGTIRRVLKFLGQEDDGEIPSPPLSRLADEISEQWVQRFRAEVQEGWERRGW